MKQEKNTRRSKTAQIIERRSKTNMKEHWPKLYQSKKQRHKNKKAPPRNSKPSRTPQSNQQ